MAHSQDSPAPDRGALLRLRWHVQQLDRSAPGRSGRPHPDAAVLDLGVQDTGADGATWALENRGMHVPRGAEDEHGLALAWTLRGAPHLYRRADLPAVARATAPFSEADAGSRIHDAARPLRAAGIPVLDALRTVAHLLREIVTEPLPKGEVSTLLTRRVDAPYVRWCTVCGATHLYEMPFRLAALHAGLELVPGTSPPVLRRIPGWRAAPFPEPEPSGGEGPTATRQSASAHDVVAGFRRFYPCATARHLAAFLDAPLAEVRERWDDAGHTGSPTGSTGSRRTAEREDRHTGELRLLGPFDPYLQLKDREVLVPDAALRRATWPTLGRPGAVALDGELVALWRPRASGARFQVRLSSAAPRAATVRPQIEEQAEALAEHRGLRFDGLVDE